ncbi:unnamed protein product [Polarella glacialis]|uniref:Metallo-beta-lactamase domain-containing protein n=2 Tax=Polarella glacialis TaxID=89957 RepID=A0A813LUN5_POLGL|nr:unnamed protein product [Polarella glacialis]
MGQSMPKQPPPNIKRDSSLRHFFEVDRGFWNCEQEFLMKKHGISVDIGNHMSLCRLANGRMVAIDAITLTDSAKAELDWLTLDGSLLEAVVLTHPFHTLGIAWFHERYPSSPTCRWYGCPRHRKVAPFVSWAGDLSCPGTRKVFGPDLEMRIPDGAEFVDPKPPSTNHFSSVFVFHRESKTIHCDDTIMYFDNPTFLAKLFGFQDGSMHFHPSIKTVGLHHSPEAPLAFMAWLKKLLEDWDFNHLVTAHKGRCFCDAKPKIKRMLENAQMPLLDLSAKWRAGREQGGGCYRHTAPASQGDFAWSDQGSECG